MVVQRANFDFLAQNWPDLHNSAEEAERLVNSAPRSSSFAARFTTEQAINWAYSADPELKRPYRDNLAALIHEQSFKQQLPPELFPSLLYVLKTGNLAAHGDPKKKPVSQSMAMMALKHLHAFLQWFALTYGDPRPETSLFDESLVPKSVEPEKTKARLEELQKELERKNREIDEKLRENQQLRENVRRVKAANEATVQSVSFAPDDATEAKTREVLIDVMLAEAGWDLSGAHDREYEVEGMPNETGVGYVDYMLWDSDGAPLAVVEAKRTSESSSKGKHQAKLYADCVEKMHGQRPIIFYTNGYEVFLWDDAKYPPRQVFGFYTRDQLRWLIRQRAERKKITASKPNANVAGRHYQLEAIQRVGERFEKGYRRALLVMATGTGKTRTAIALVDVMLQSRWAQRVLFLADRRALVNQAHNAFQHHLPSVSVAKYAQGQPDTHARVVIATYPSILNGIDEVRGGTREFSVGEFDLVIIDEAHRSIYKKYGAIFDYFDSLVLGLTATPKDEVDRNTYHFFDLESGMPTAAYELDQAVNHGYLVPFRNLSVPIKFPRKGIKYSELSEEEKQEYEEKFYDDDSDSVPDLIEANRVNKWVFNEDTVDKVIQYLMEHGQKVAGGDKLGKTIVFARNHEHAEFISQRFDKLYPDKKGDFLRVIDNQVKYSQNLIDRFSIKDEEPVIAVSVDMLDTGIDVPEVLNLVFFKVVRSRAKFWQMIGRGTRLCPDLLGPGEDKREFLILDFCENFEFFGENPEGIEPRAQPTLTERLFNKRLTLAERLRHGDYQDQKHTALRKALLDALHGEVKRIQEQRGATIAVRKQRKYLDTFAKRSRWDNLGDVDKEELRRHIAPLTFAEDEDELARRFDLLCFDLAISLVDDSPEQTQLADQLRSIADYLFLNAMSIPTVKRKSNTIERIRQDDFWNHVEPSDADWIRQELRGLIQFVERSDREAIVRTTFQDEMGEAKEGPDLTAGAFDTRKYQDAIRTFMREHKEHLVIQKIRLNQRITTEELKELDRLLSEANLGSLDKLREAFSTDAPVALLIRGLVGLDVRAAKEAFSDFIQRHPSLSADQMHFLDLLIDHLSRDGYVDPERLVDVPYTNKHPQGVLGVFAEEQAEELKSVLSEIRRRAEVG